MAIISEQWAELLDPGIHHFFEQGFARRTPVAPSLFNIQRSMKSDEDVVGIGAVGIDAWDNYENAGVASVADFDQGYKKTYTHKEYPLEMIVERKLLEDDQYNQINRMAFRMGDSAALKRETDAASVFNNAFTDTDPYDGADGVGLCSAAHPNSPAKTGATQSNEDTLPLTKTNVATVRERMMAFTDDAENLVAVNPRLLLVPPELEDEALVIANSLFDPDSGNNAINPQSTRFSVLTWHYLTDANAWFMIDPDLMMMGLDWFDRVPLQINLKNTDRTLKSTWIAYMRYSYGWSDWRWIYGNNPS